MFLEGTRLGDTVLSSVLVLLNKVTSIMDKGCLISQCNLLWPSVYMHKDQSIELVCTAST